MKEEGNLLGKESLFIESLRNKQFTVYMLSNQLPLLQMGRHPAEVIGQTEAYCNAAGDHYKNRIVNKMEVVAFSDPNDLLSSENLAGGLAPDTRLVNRGCVNCHSQIHGSNHPSGARFHR